MNEDKKQEGSRIVLTDTDYDRFLTILAEPPKLSLSATERLRRKRAWEE